jgi:hypothetical protein
VNYKHALIPITLSIIVSFTLVSTAAMANGPMQPGSTGGRSPGARWGGMPQTGVSGDHSFFVPGYFKGMLPDAGTHMPGYESIYVHSPWVPENPSFGPTPTQRPVKSSPPPMGAYSPFGPTNPGYGIPPR